MNRGNLAEDPRVGRPSSSRYSYMDADRQNALLYANVRSRRKNTAKEKVSGSEGKKNNLRAKDKTSVGRRLPDSHMDRLEVGSDGRLFGVHVKAAAAPEKTRKAEPEQAQANPPVSQAAPAVAKPRRDYLNAANPLLSMGAVSVRHTPEVSLPKSDTKDGDGSSGTFSVRKAILAAVLGAGVAFYGYTAMHFQNRFYPGTSFFGIDACNKSVTDIKAAIAAKVSDYSLELVTRDGTTNIITADEIELQYEDDGAVDEAMSKQYSFIWPVMMAVNALSDHTAELETKYNYSLLTEVAEALPCFDEENITAPQDAQIVLGDTGAYIEPQVIGTTLDEDATIDAIRQAVNNGWTSITLNDLGLYENPEVYSDDTKLNEEVRKLNEVLGAKVTIDFDDRPQTVDSEKIYEFLSTGVDGSYYIDSDKVREYVASLAEEFDTWEGERDFYTSLGTTVELSGGDYGWEMDQEATYEELMEALRSKSTETIEPVYTHTAMSRAADDIGDTYVEVSTTTQEMWFYKDGALVVHTPVVTGNPLAGNDTPSNGVWALDGKYRNATLRGEGYASPVDYWMPFNGGVGIHDLQSRYYFGGQIYKGGGSHGCINTPLAAVKLIYANIEEGTPVVVYTDESDEAMSLITDPVDKVTVNAEIEETYGTADDDGYGSLVSQQAAIKAAASAAAAASATTATTAATATTATASSTPAS